MARLSRLLVDSGMWLQWDPHIAAVRELRRMPPPRGLAHLELIEVMFAAFPPPLAQRKFTLLRATREDARAVTRASAETALDARESAKAALLRAIEPVERGVTATEEDDVLPVPMMVHASAEQAGDLIDGEDLPAVVAELAYDIEMLTVEQAVVRIELSGENMLMFRNASHFGLNVVQLRDDGSIGWIDPRGARRLANSG